MLFNVEVVFLLMIEVEVLLKTLLLVLANWRLFVSWEDFCLVLLFANLPRISAFLFCKCFLLSLRGDGPAVVLKLDTSIWLYPRDLF